MTMQFEVQGMEELQNRLNRGNETMRATLNAGLLDIGKLFVPAKGTGPLAAETPKRTGKLACSTFFEIESGPKGQQLVVLQPAQTEEGDFYGWFVREGIAPHEIRPKNKQALAWGREIAPGKKEFVRRKVNHPGTKANAYHKRVLARHRHQVQYIVNRMGERITAYLSGKGG